MRAADAGGGEAPLPVARRRRPALGPLRARRRRALRAARDAGARRAAFASRRADPAPADPPRADVVVWACGSWLPGSFPGLVEQKISRRDVFFFGAGGDWAGTPGFCDYEAPFYGHGDLGGLGIKVAPDTRRRRDRPGLARPPAARGERAARARVRRTPLPVARRRADHRRPRLPVRPHRRHAFPRRAASRAGRTGGSSAEARATASSTAPRWPSTSRTASRRSASRSRSTASARACRARACARRRSRARASLGPEVLDDDRLVRRIVDPRDDHRAPRPRARRSRRERTTSRRDPHRRALAELDDLVVELELELPGEDEVDLLLRVVPVAVRRPCRRCAAASAGTSARPARPRSRS